MDVEGTAGNDSLQGSDGSDQLFGRNGNDTLSGGEGNDLLVAGFGDDTIYGGGGVDTLSFEEDFGDDIAFGDAGDDVMLDRSGTNTLHGGEGNDRFLFFYSHVEDSATTGIGGAGRDDYVLGAPTLRLYPVTYTVADFATGASGDRIDVEALLAESGLGGFYTGGNPFEVFLRLREESGDVLVEWDQDGAGTVHDWLTLVTLSDPFSDLAAGSLTSDNFVGGLAPNGLVGAGQSLGGTADAETLIGGSGDDTLSGAEADDRLEGRHGDDSLLGDAGHDVLVGGFGNDTLSGSEGNDTLNLENDFGDDVVFGGAGDDVLRDRAGTNTLDGGEGADTFILGYQRDEAEDPADALVLGYSHAGGGGTTMIGGPGRDVFLVEPPRGTEPAYIAADFEVGSGGDLIDLDDVLTVSALNGSYGGGNPFIQGIVRLQNSGSDMRLEWYRDGAGSEPWITLLTMSNRAGAIFTMDNFVGGIDPDGSSPAGQLLNGTENPEILLGGGGDDTAHGAGQDDRIEGANGNDALNGDAGNDTLVGGFGADTVRGGDGNDDLSDVGFGNDHLFGDAGDDFIVDRAGSNVIDGGDGNDEFMVWFTEAGGGATVTGGAGRDLWTWGIITPETPLSDYVVTDFQAGAGGDLLQPQAMLVASGSQGHYSGGNPFLQKILRLVQSGDDTLFQWDQNGTVDGAEWITVLRLQGIDRTTITSDNFVGELIVGTPGDDSLSGGLGNDTVLGLAGDDTLDGSAGRDILEGSSGDDFYFVDHASDSVIEENNDAPTALLLPGGGGQLAGVAGITDTVIASVNYSLANADFVENLTLAGTASNATGNALANTLTGNARNNVLDGKGGADVLKGGGGNDTLAWQAADRFDGGGGKDTLTLKAGNLNLTRIADSRIRNVEQVDMDGSKDNTLTLSATDVLALSGSTNTLRVFGNDGDGLDLIGPFLDMGVTRGFHKYQSGLAIVLIGNDIAVI